MILHVDPGDPVPPYQQIRMQIATMVVAGVLAPGARLPAIRQLAGDLGLASGTVARAYRELERDGVVATRGRHGTRVLPRDTVTPPSNREQLEVAARAFAVRVRQMGVDARTALDAARAALAALPEPESGPDCTRSTRNATKGAR
jgi:GntR family transcriptional regulator